MEEILASEESPLLLDHEHDVFESDASKDTKTLLIACIVTTFFFFTELVGGYLAGSLAIMSDAAHLLSDLAGFAISLVAVSVSRLPANARLSFGFARAEVLGAFVSILFIWALTIVLVLFAIQRLFHPSPVNGPLMMLLGVIGLMVNLILGLVLGHSHSHDHGADQVHSDPVAPMDIEKQSRAENEAAKAARERDHGHSHGHDVQNGGHDHGHDHGHSHKEQFSRFSWDSLKALIFGRDERSVNVRAAYLHVLGDALQNVGVIFAAMVITIFPNWSFIDPVCTLFFAIIVVMTTTGLAKETMAILMEGTPATLQLSDVYHSLCSLDGVSRVGDLHAWSITARSHSLSVHLYQKAATAGHDILKDAQNMLRARFGISHATIQVNCEAVECCDEEYLLAGSSKRCVSSNSLRARQGAT